MGWQLVAVELGACRAGDRACKQVLAASGCGLKHRCTPCCSLALRCMSSSSTSSSTVTVTQLNKLFETQAWCDWLRSGTCLRSSAAVMHQGLCFKTSACFFCWSAAAWLVNHPHGKLPGSRFPAQAASRATTRFVCVQLHRLWDGRHLNLVIAL
jgi:hypothetical protein